MDESRSSRTVGDTLVDIARKWRLIVPFAIVTPLVVYALTSSQPAMYSSSADVLLNRQGFVISDLRDPTFWYPNRAQLTQAQLARLPDVAQRVVDAAGLTDRGRFGFLAQSWLVAGQFTDVMSFHVRDGDPQLAARLATIYAEQYISYRRSLDTQSLRQAIRVVDRELARLRTGSRDPVLYADLVQKQQQLHTALASVETNAMLVRSGGEAVRIARHPLRASALGLLLGLVMGVGLAGLSRLFDPRAETADEISSQVGLSLLGRLPLDARSSRRRSTLEPEHRDDDPYVEAMQLLRTSLELDERARGQRVLMVTSAVAGECKSTTVANLALALARAGRDVVLVDLDLGRPSVARLFGVPSAPGVVDLVLGRRSIEGVVHVVSLDGSRDGAPGLGGPALAMHAGTLRVVPTGAFVSADPGELAAGADLPAALEQLRALGDIVLVDAPPLLRSGDALALSAHVDGLLLVANMQRYRRRYGPAVRHALALSPAVPLGLVVIGERRKLEYDPADAPAGPRGGDPDIYAFGRA